MASDDVTKTGTNLGEIIISLIIGGLATYGFYKICESVNETGTKTLPPSRVDGERKYSLFLSSTYKDLAGVRKSVLNTLSAVGYIVEGMERFPASDKEKKEYIESKIVKTDYLVLLIGKRYGQLIPGKSMSYTEYEFDHAVKNEVPVLAFILSDSEEIDDPEDDHNKLKAFKKKVEEKMSLHCNISDLMKHIQASINDAISTTPRPGWSRN